MPISLNSCSLTFTSTSHNRRFAATPGHQLVSVDVAAEPACAVFLSLSAGWSVSDVLAHPVHDQSQFSGCVVKV